MRHHTKDKGDIGLACVMADLLNHGIQVALPVSEHLPFDLIAISEAGPMVKVSVKYRELDGRGGVSVHSRSSWADRHGVHVKERAPGDYDAVAIYCPGTNQCYYLRASELSRSRTTLRISPAANNQTLGVRAAESFLDPDRIFFRPP
jgi:hypothetical protein